MRTSVVAVSLCLLVLLLSDAVHQVTAQPVKFSKWEEYLEATGRKLTYKDNNDNKCAHGGHVRDLCEKCAKFTKNEVVFPLCCEERENVRSWCKKFLEYTPAEPSSLS